MRRKLRPRDACIDLDGLGWRKLGWVCPLDRVLEVPVKGTEPLFGEAPLGSG